MTSAPASTSVAPVGPSVASVGPPRLPVSRRAPSLWRAAVLIFDLSLARMLWSRGTIFMALLVGLPVVLAVLVRGLQAIGAPNMRIEGQVVSGPTIFGFMVWWLYLRFIVPVLALYYGTALVADEVEDKTITYLFTRPIRRGAVLLGKFLAYFVCTVMVVLPSLMIVYFLMGLSGATLAGTFPSLLKDLGLIILGLLAYGGLFAWVGARFKRPLVIGLVFVFGFEQLALIIPGYIRYATVSFYLQSLVPHAVMGEGVVSLLQSLVQQKASLGTALVMLIGIGAAFVGLAMRVIARRDYVLEQ
jgi:ABC-type transport system involved in multi-copper enzyme maturation permease subunit